MWNHDANYVLGRTKSETLTLSEDERGLKYEIIPPDTTWARDLMTLIKRRDVSQSSFGFNIVERRVKNDKESHETTVTLTEVKLFDVSPVTFPAYSNTEVHVRMIAGEMETAYLFEDSGEVVVVPVAEAKAPGVEPTDEELFREFEHIMGKVFKR
jgi:HK97 family phage prohead protease